MRTRARLAAAAALLLLASAPAGAQPASSTTSAATTAQTVRPVPPVRPQAGPTAQPGTSPADVEKQVRDMILRQGRLQMNALVPGSGLALSPDRFEDPYAPPAPSIAPPARTEAAPAASSAVRRPAPRVQRFRMGERVSEPLPLRKAGNYGW